MPVLNLEQIKEIIPHRDPFLLIDEVVELEPGVRAVAKKYLKPDEFWFKGHFPQEPVQPGVLTIEMLAQTGAVCALCLPENKGKIAFFCRHRQSPLPRQSRPRRHPDPLGGGCQNRPRRQLLQRRRHGGRQKNRHRGIFFGTGGLTAYVS